MCLSSRAVATPPTRRGATPVLPPGSLPPRGHGQRAQGSHPLRVQGQRYQSGPVNDQNQPDPPLHVQHLDAPALLDKVGNGQHPEEIDPPPGESDPPPREIDPPPAGPPHPSEASPPPSAAPPHTPSVYLRSRRPDLLLASADVPPPPA